uniref:Condensin complex subunit 1 C-terminal domain-containing protein n=1 Tax=Hucho hucho TaxID=62062 RepID=A0A4W5PTT1_9TELE
MSGCGHGGPSLAELHGAGCPSAVLPVRVPDQLCSRLLQRCSRLLLDQIAEGGEMFANKDVSQFPGASQDPEEQGEQVPAVSCVSLAQLLSLCGCVAFWQVSHLERSVSSELRRRRGETEEREEKAKVPYRKAKQAANDSSVEEELGLMGASAEDTEAELIRKICETELLAEENLLCLFLPLLVRVCSSPGRYCHPQLTTAACLALSQYMMISPSVCEEHIRLLFTVLERSSLPVVRANAIIGLGDLTVRFPNIQEPWTQNLYTRLSDENPAVRQTAVTVHTQLVLKDVLKVRSARWLYCSSTPRHTSPASHSTSSRSSPPRTMLSTTCSQTSSADCQTQREP